MTSKTYNNSGYRITVVRSSDGDVVSITVEPQQCEPPGQSRDIYSM